ncbi:MAG: class II aldolase/adducin family protein [Planctomycetales bacterium]|nr:class II aldolase/adducin family protein [Planctomycetales bacterium]
MTTDARQLKQEICDVGLRLYQRGLVAGSDGNITTRLTEEQVLCTPTMLCKGLMKPEDICVVDMEGNQLAGVRKRTSEVLLHLEIMKARPDVQSVIHCHAPHATAFAISGKPVPRAVMPETEFFFGEIPTAAYETPGTAAFARTILPYVERTNVCLLANHGTVTYAESLELAYNYTEILDAYCRILLLSQPLGPPVKLPADKCRELEALRLSAGLAPPKVVAGGTDQEDRGK